MQCMANVCNMFVRRRGTALLSWCLIRRQKVGQALTTRMNLYSTQPLPETKPLNGFAHPEGDIGGEPKTVLHEKAALWGCSITERCFAEKMDMEDPLKELRHEFFYPKIGTLPEVDESLVDMKDECVYLCGNSLGLQPTAVREYLNEMLQKWALMGVEGHFHGKFPWKHSDEVLEVDCAKLLGAKREEVGIMNSLTVNQHLLLTSFYRPTAERHKILMESRAFPSDHYCIESQIRLHGYDPETSMICMEPREGEDILRKEDIVQRIEEEGESIAVVFFSGIQYYTGQLFDMPEITKAGHAKGCYVGFDLAHAVGNVELSLHDWDVDFASWCSYKYMNAGAGGIGGMFLHEKFAQNDFPKMLGWWGHRLETRFNMDNKMDLYPGARGYRISNTPVMLTVALQGALQVFNKTSMCDLRQKSELLTGYLEALLKLHFSKPTNGFTSSRPYVDILTPSDPAQRGCQLSVSFSVPVANVYRELKRRGVVLDKREPNVLRVAPVPLYNSFKDVHRFIELLNDSLLAVANSV